MRKLKSNEIWLPLADDGDHLHKPSGLTQHIDRGVRERLATVKKGQPVEIPIDFDHQEPDLAKGTLAGYVTRLENRRDGLYGLAFLTRAGLDAIRSGGYKGVSPVFKCAKPDDNGRTIPIGIRSVALTNNPNIPLWIANSGSHDNYFDGPTSALAPPWYGNGLDYQLQLTSLLGLAASASNAEIRASLNRRLGLPFDAYDAQRQAAYRGMRNRGLRWKPWLSGSPTFENDDADISDDAADRMTNTICRHRTPEQIQAYANIHEPGSKLHRRLVAAAAAKKKQTKR